MIFQRPLTTFGARIVPRSSSVSTENLESKLLSKSLWRSYQLSNSAARNFSARVLSASTPATINTESSTTLPLTSTQQRPRIINAANENISITQMTKFHKPRRRFSTTPFVLHGHITAPKPGEELHVTFVTKEGDEETFDVSEGDNLLDIAQANDLEMEGACGGSCACSTCHVIIEDQDVYDKLEEPDDDENDMLDLAFGLTETSRLGCQVKMSKDIDGFKVRLPTMTRNLQKSDFDKK